MKAPVIKYFLVLLLICKLGSADSSAQYSNERNSTSRVSERIFFGGSFGLQLGTITNIQLSPVIGMWLLRPLSIAAGPTWQYYKDPLGKTSIYGGRSFMRLMFVRDISQFIPLGMRLGFYLHGEYEALSLESGFWTATYTDNTRFWEHTALAGLGISQAIGIKSSFNITFLWPVTYSEYSLYDSPEIRIDLLF